VCCGVLWCALLSCASCMCELFFVAFDLMVCSCFVDVEDRAVSVVM
jgi:hypothetical protein